MPFSQVNNAYVFRGRLRKRFGSEYTGNPQNAQNSRLAINMGTTNSGTGNLSVTLGAGGLPAVTGAIGQQFSVGTTIFTVYQASGAMLVSGTGSGTFDTGTGALVLLGAPKGLPVYFYPAQPVMGLGIYESGPVANQPAMAFDLHNPYQYNGTSWQWLNGATTTPLFTGTDLDYFWTSNWQGSAPSDVAFFVTNNVDPIWYWYPTPGGLDWAMLQPVFDTNGDYVVTARIILPFQGHTIMLNTTEQINGGSKNTYVNRVRWSAWGSPLPQTHGLFQHNHTWEITLLVLSFDDAGTKEAIIGAEFIKDRLIGYFEQSTYELAFTGNHTAGSFQWQKINTELGAVGTFSTIPFDKAVLGIGKTGVHACSGANVERIDFKIPDQIFEFKVEGESYNRIAGIRVYQPELAVWSYVEEK